MNYLYILVAGIIIGTVNIIPGVSGGTMAVILNLFDRIIEAISGLKQNFKENILFLFFLGAGALIGILAFTWLISWCLSNYSLATNFFFIGLILGSVPMILKRATADCFKPYQIIPCVIAFGVMIFTVFFSPNTTGIAVITDLTLLNFIWLLLAAVLASACMIIPGISGSFVMLLLGTYPSVTAAIRDFNIPVLIPIFIGCVIGLVGGAKLIRFLLERYPQATYFTIFGLVLGSVPTLLKSVFWNENGFAFSFSWELMVGAIVLLLGFLMAFFLGSRIKEKESDPPKSTTRSSDCD